MLQAVASTNVATKNKKKENNFLGRILIKQFKNKNHEFNNRQK
jgi:hypothetical protein